MESNTHQSNVRLIMKRGILVGSILLILSIGSFFFSRAIGVATLCFLVTWIGLMMFAYIQVTRKYEKRIVWVLFLIVSSVMLAILALLSIPVNYFL